MYIYFQKVEFYFCFISIYLFEIYGFVFHVFYLIYIFFSFDTFI